MPTQNVNLTPELDQFVRSLVESGDFNNASEVHRAALTALRKSEEERRLRLEYLRSAIQQGVDDIEAGRFTRIENQDDLAEVFARCREAALSEGAST